MICKSTQGLLCSSFLVLLGLSVRDYDILNMVPKEALHRRVWVVGKALTIFHFGAVAVHVKAALESQSQHRGSMQMRLRMICINRVAVPILSEPENLKIQKTSLGSPHMGYK